MKLTYLSTYELGILLASILHLESWICAIAHPFVILLMLTLKIMSSLHTLGVKACTLLSTLVHTRFFMTCLLVILFLCGLRTLQSILSKWERSNVMLYEIKKMRIIGRFMFNGGFLWEGEPRMMKNYIIIVGRMSGNVIM